MWMKQFPISSYRISITPKPDYVRKHDNIKIHIMFVYKDFLAYLQTAGSRSDDRSEAILERKYFLNTMDFYM